MLLIFIVGVGGFVGSALRYVVSNWVQNFSREINFPYGTLVVNLLGCFLIGFLAHLSESRNLLSNSVRDFVFIGVLGGFTTFSAFSNETINLIRVGETRLAILNVLIQVVLCLSSVCLGRGVASGVWR